MYKDKILALKEELGSDLCIMGHHYQSDAVIQYVDKVGDSLELSRMMDQIDAKHIVFCGVNFMAEGAVLLAKEGQYVHIPDEKADCVMAQMVPADLLDKVLTDINSSPNYRAIPLAYVNTPLAVKAIVGKHGGAVCTSANAKMMMEWAIKEANAHEDIMDCKVNGVLFLPDANLAQNTAKQLNIAPHLLRKIDIREKGTKVAPPKFCSNDTEILMWPGCCAVHAKLRKEHMEKARADYPDAIIALHPECSPEIVDLADHAGSTSFLIKLANEAKDGSTLIIGTELNLVARLAKEHAGRINILPLKEVECSNMMKITEEKLYYKLLEIKEGKAVPFAIDTSLKENALLSLTRMLEAGKK